MRSKVAFGLLSIFFLSLTFNKTWAQPLKSYGKGAPKLVVGIVIENMRPDYIDRYWDKFQDNGFKKLYTQGAVCSNFKIEQHIQSYPSGMATLYTGVFPATHGIIDKAWYDRLKEKVVDCVEDNYYFTVGADTKAGNASPSKLMANTIGDNLKVFTRGKSKVYSIAMNSASAIFSSGHAADGAYWFDIESGRMISSSFYLSTFPNWVRIFNSQGLAEIYTHRNWVTLLPITSYSESIEDEYLLERGYFGKWNTFPHVISRYVKRTGNFAPLKTTPFANTIISSFAKELITNEPIATDEYTDLITVVFSSMDYENGSFGPASLEMEDLYLRLDQDIAGLIDFLENKFGKDDILVYLTSNTSASYPVEYLKEEFNLNVGNFSPESAIALLTSYLNITYGDDKWIENVTGQEFYLNHKLIERRKVDLDEMVEKAAVFINQFKGVKIVLPSFDLERGGNGSAENSALYNSFCKNRSGDFSFILEEGWQPLFKYRRVNYTDQTHVPLVFYGKNIIPKNIKARHLAIDLVPTLSDLIGIPAPDRCQGKIIDLP